MTVLRSWIRHTIPVVAAAPFGAVNPNYALLLGGGGWQNQTYQHDHEGEHKKESLSGKPHIPIVTSDNQPDSLFSTLP
jgi:hypothetical protein